MNFFFCCCAVAYVDGACALGIPHSISSRGVQIVYYPLLQSSLQQVYWMGALSTSQPAGLGRVAHLKLVLLPPCRMLGVTGCASCAFVSKLWLQVQALQ